MSESQAGRPDLYDDFVPLFLDFIRHHRGRIRSKMAWISFSGGWVRPGSTKERESCESPVIEQCVLELLNNHLRQQVSEAVLNRRSRQMSAFSSHNGFLRINKIIISSPSPCIQDDCHGVSD